MWELVSKGEKLTLLCVGLGLSPQTTRNAKWSNDERDNGESEPLKISKMEALGAEIK